MLAEAATREFDRQVQTLVDKGCPELAGLERLRTLVPEGAPKAAIRFVLVVKREVVATERALSLVEVGGKRGFVGMDPTEPDEYAPIDGLDVPAGPAYLLVDVDTGRETLNVTPDDALERILAAGRSPLTIDEGVALLTHFPDVLVERNAFSLLGSRRGDRRVPALWMSRGAPRLGWCWAGNPHTWLGSASCAARIGA